MSCNICACKGSARSSCSIFSGSESGLNWYSKPSCFGKGRGSIKTPSKLFTNHNAQLTNHNTFRFFGRWAFFKTGTNRAACSGLGERYCNNVNYVKNNAFLEPPIMIACSSTPPKQNQDFVKEHNRTPLKRGTCEGQCKVSWTLS